MERRAKKILMLVMGLVFLLSEYSIAQTKPHSAVIGGVKQRFKNAANDPGDADRIYQESIDLLLQNNIEHDKKDKDKEESWYFLGAVYFFKNEYDKAYEAMQNSLKYGKRFLEKGEKIAGGLVLFSIKETINDIKLKTFKRAEKAQNDGMAMATTDVDSMKALLTKAIELYSALLSYDETATINQQSVISSVLLGMSNANAKLMEVSVDPAEKERYRKETVSLYEKLYAQNRGNLSISYNVFQMHRTASDWAKALQWIDTCMASPATDSSAKQIKIYLIQQKIIIYKDQLGQPDKALTVYNDLIKNDPTNPDWHFNLAGLYYELKQPDKALEELRTVKRMNPADAEASFQVANQVFGAYLRHRGDVIDSNGGVFKADMKKVTALLQPDIDECVTFIKDAIESLDKSSQNEEMKTYRIGILYNAMAEVEGHINWALENRDRVKVQKPFFEKAVQYLKKTTELNPDHKDAWRNLFIAYTNLQMVKERDAAMKKFEALNK